MDSPPSGHLAKRKHSIENGVVKLKIADASSLVEEKKATLLNTGAWNPHRNSMFNSNVFHKDEKVSLANDS